MIVTQNYNKVDSDYCENCKHLKVTPYGGGVTPECGLIKFIELIDPLLVIYCDHRKFKPQPIELTSISGITIETDQSQDNLPF